MMPENAIKRCAFPLPLLLLLPLPLPLPLSAHTRQLPDHDVLHYKIAITVSDSSDAIAGRTELTVRSVHSTSHMFLNLKDLDIDRVLIGNKPAVFNQKDEGVFVQFPTEIEAGETLRIAIDYSGVPDDGLSIKKNKYGRRTFFADNWPNRARYWFPGVDHPSDKASVEFHITAPTKYNVVANGGLTRRTNNLNGTQTTSYSEPVAIPTYCMVFGAAEFDVVESGTFAGKQLSLWIFPQDVEDALHDFSRAGNMVEYFSRRFGPFPFAKLANVQSSTRFGGMENAGSIFYAEKSIGTERNIEGTVAHEIVHQWFGDHITEKEWPHLWLSEGFATYFGTQYFEYADGVDRFRELMAQRRASYLSQVDLHKHAIVEDEPEDLFKLLNGNNYTKGGWVLHILRSQIGDGAFWRGVRLYADRFAGKNALTDDFRKVMEEASGESLGWFFGQWIFSPGIPELAIRYTWQEQSKKLKIELDQMQAHLMRIPLKILFKANTDHVETFWLTKKKETLYVSLPSKPADIIVDPNVELLADIVVEKAQ